MIRSASDSPQDRPISEFVELARSSTVRGGSVLRAGLFIERPIDEVFRFFSDAHNLERITPPDLKFDILTPAPIDMHAGTLIDYKLRVRRIPIRWRTLINVWEPPHRFVDEQLRGPYRMWHHEHTFQSVAGGTNVIDRVTFRPIGGALMTRLFVGRDVRRIFEFRARVLKQIFALHKAISAPASAG